MEHVLTSDRRPALVFLCQRLPYAPVTGELITTFNMVRHLARRYRIFVGTFIDDPTDRIHVQEVERTVAGLHTTVRTSPWSWIRAFPYWLAGEPVSFALFRSRDLERWLDSIERQYRPVAIVTHSSNVSAYAVDRFKRKTGEGPRRILHFADVDSEKFVAYGERSKGVMKWAARLEARRVRREELRITARADAVAFVSDDEANLFKSMLDGGQDRIVTLPNGVDTDLFDPARYSHAPFRSAGHAFVFTGAMDYRPNVDAVTWFAREVFPGLKASLPSPQFIIVGSKPSAEVKRLSADPSVLVTGKVDSVAAYVAHAQVAVAPLQIARGVQNKVLEAMAMAKPQVVSPGALTGIAAIPGTHLLCASSPEEWVSACTKLSLDLAGAAAMGRAARNLVLQRYSWPAQLKKLDEVLEQH